MKNLAMVAILSAATAAILTAICNAVWKGSNNDDTAMRDNLGEALANYYSRREFLRNYRPLAGELAKGREVMQEYIKTVRDTCDEESAQRLENIQARIDECFAETEAMRNECLTDEYIFDQEDFSLEQASNMKQLRAIADDLKQATNAIEECIKQLESDATWWRREYMLAKVGLKICPKE